LDEIIYQKIPTFRVHLKDNQAVGEWHRDRDYNHGKSEVNIWLPFTDAYDTNTIWIESEEDKNDFKPYNVSYGEVLVFNGANLIHGNKTNIEHDTRVSVDFRIVNPTEFIPSTKGSINTNTSFDIGGYFQKL
jgi:ectoine hydroxylase-related dioxygenase (phytanoyl-CoA dioxygenase family)